MVAFSCIIGERLGLQTSKPTAVWAFGVCNMPNAGDDQRNEKTDAPGILRGKCDDADQTANTADENAYLLNDDGNLADHYLFPFVGSFITSHT